MNNSAGLFRSLLVDARRGNRAQQIAQIELLLDQMLRQGGQQFWIAGWVRQAKVIDGLDQSTPQHVRPGAVGPILCEVRIFRRRHPGGELRASIARLAFNRRRLAKRMGNYLLAGARMPGRCFSRRRQDRTAAETVPQKAQNSAE